MTELSTDVKKYAIITWSKAHHLITEKEHDLLRMLGGKDLFQTSDGNTITGGDIASILTVEKYYETYPDKKPSQLYRTDLAAFDVGLTEKPITPHGLIKKAPKRGLQEMMKGFLKRGNASHPLYKAMQARLDGKPISETKEYNPKYVGQEGWDQAKADGVF